MKDIHAHLQRGDWSGAERLCRERLARLPADAQANFLLAFVLWRTARPVEALDRCREAAALSGDDPGLLSDLGNLLRELGAHGEALEALDQSLRLRPGHQGTRYNRALVLDVLGRDDEALRMIEGIGPRHPLFPGARFLRGTIRQDYGDMDGAEADFLDCIGADAGNARAWHALALTRRFEAGEEIFRGLKKALAAAAGDPDARCRFLFALAKVHDDVGQHEAASEYLAGANRLVEARYDQGEIEARLRQLRRPLPAFGSAAARGATRPCPVFIVGLPRSGSTLVETLLEKHSQVFSLGESNLLPELLADILQPLGAKELAARGARYLEGMPPGARRAAVVVDKMPGNFWRVGHIGAMFPGAGIIHCQRDPRDVALSNYFNLYESGNSFAYDLENLAHFTACHDAIMAHWKKCPGNRIFSLDYAALVAGPRRVLGDIIAWLSLEWEPGMLDRPAKRRRVRTASNWQVRQEIYTSSVDRWQRYPRLAGEFMSHYQRYTAQLAAS